MNRVACIVCNYNKREFVMNCVKSLLEQTMDGLDIFVIDNASVDGSVEMLKERYKDRISVIVNRENLGGSGGFNIGLRLVLDTGIYQYVVLIDNDVFLEKSAIQKMYDYMEIHRDVGILGPKILQMAHPDIVQDLGGSITERYKMSGNYNGMKEVELPGELDCAYISTCTAMARVDAVKRFGLMPEENFIYWDDVEWSKKCQMSGYRTVAISTASVWHNHSNVEEPSCFTKYYLTRNMLKFFSRYLDDSKINIFKEKIMEEIYTLQFMLAYQGASELSEAVMFAWNDFLDHKYGKADSWKIQIQGKYDSSFVRAFEGKKIVLRRGELSGFSQGMTDVFFDRLQKINNVRFVVDNMGCEEIIYHMKKNNIRYEVISSLETCNKNEEYYNLFYCDHIKKINHMENKQIYMDSFLNCVSSQKELDCLKRFESSFDVFKTKYSEKFEKSIMELRKVKDE